MAREKLSKVTGKTLMDQARVLETEDRHTSGAYPKRPIAIVRGQGLTVWDAEGRAYLDMTSGQGVALLGHSHPALVEAVKRQTARLITCPEIFYNDQRAAFYEALSACTPKGIDRFFLCNSGSEAIEGAIKLVRWSTGRPGIVAAKGGFHGRTLGALSATWKEEYRVPFEPLVPDFSHIPYNDSEAAAVAIGQKTAAVLVEVVQGEGGVHPAETTYLHTLRRLCDEHGALLIFDEIQTGFGRTGRCFALEHHDVVPDVLCLGKGIAGGLPMGVVAWQRSLGSLPRSSHGTTFGGNALVCAAALATLRVLAEQDLPGHAAKLGGCFLEQLHALDNALIREVRGQGLMIGIELRRRVTPILKRLMEHGVLALPAGSTVLRLLPPLIIEEEHLEQTYQVLTRVLGELEYA